ncbi:methyltransferase TYW3-domain-containing protein [Astrocystis sublimbata]|nr:methyltransferase TYW3-domain-containing protein [Astrocystis sublimbata]
MRNLQPLPPPPAHFSRKKERIIEQLAVPDADYSDASPKGSVDAGIRDLIQDINALDGFVTTSSCAGRVSVFVEGRKAAHAGGAGLGENGDGDGDEDAAGDAARPATLAAVGGKGGGGAWLFVSHDPVCEIVEGIDMRSLLGLGSPEKEKEGNSVAGTSFKDMRLIHFKFEPMILHVLAASLEHAQLMLRAGLQAGFRESGAINLTSTTAEPVTPMVALRSMGLSFESLIGVQEDGVTKCMVSDEYLRSLLDIANERFEENKKRIERFRTAVLAASHPPSKKKEDGTEWEDAQARRERKRAEGLRRKAELELQCQGQKEAKTGTASGGVDLDVSMNTAFT